jgi:hypothetical protein
VLGVSWHASLLVAKGSQKSASPHGVADVLVWTAAPNHLVAHLRPPWGRDGRALEGRVIVDVTSFPQPVVTTEVPREKEEK